MNVARGWGMVSIVSTVAYLGLDARAVEVQLRRSDPLAVVTLAVDARENQELRHSAGVLHDAIRHGLAATG